LEFAFKGWFRDKLLPVAGVNRLTGTASEPYQNVSRETFLSDWGAKPYKAAYVAWLEKGGIARIHCPMLQSLFEKKTRRKTGVFFAPDFCTRKALQYQRPNFGAKILDTVEKLEFYRRSQLSRPQAGVKKKGFGFSIKPSSAACSLRMRLVATMISRNRSPRAKSRFSTPLIFRVFQQYP
jgi:hypothetical protein